jgi:hypothetical protein
VGRPLDCLLGLGQDLLRAATRKTQAEKHDYQSARFQVDPDSLRCWKDRKPYSEEIYRQALHGRKQHASKGSAVQLQWKTCADFSKIAAAALD